MEEKGLKETVVVEKEEEEMTLEGEEECLPDSVYSVAVIVARSLEASMEEEVDARLNAPH